MTLEDFETRRQKILANAENRLRKIQGIPLVKEDVNILDKATLANLISPIEEHKQDEIDNKDFGNLQQTEEPSSEIRLRRALPLRTDETSDSEIENEPTNVAVSPHTLEEASKYFALNSAYVKTITWCLKHKILFYLCLAIIVRFILSTPFAFLVRESALLPFLIAYSILFFSPSISMTVKTSKTAIKLENKTSSSTPNQILKMLLILFKFDPQTIETITLALNFAQFITKDFSVYFVFFVLCDKLIF